MKLKTDSGLTGISETYGGGGPLAGLEAIRSRMVGMDAFQLALLYRYLAEDAEISVLAATGGRSTFAAIEIACLDLIGQAVGKPVCDLLGGRVRDAVSFFAYLFYKRGLPSDRKIRTDTGAGGRGDSVECRSAAGSGRRWRPSTWPRSTAST